MDSVSKMTVHGERQEKGGEKNKAHLFPASIKKGGIGEHYNEQGGEGRCPEIARFKEGAVENDEEQGAPYAGHPVEQPAAEEVGQGAGQRLKHENDLMNGVEVELEPVHHHQKMNEQCALIEARGGRFSPEVTI